MVLSPPASGRGSWIPTAMVLSPDDSGRGSVWYPQSTVLNHIGTKLFRSNKESDVAFTVGCSGKLFKAHKCVLALSSATLYELVLTKSNDNNEESHEINITLADIGETVFEKILKFIYTGEYPDISRYDEECVKDVFLAANRLDCTDLKLYAESVLIEKHLVSSNAAEMILFADSHSCALLKEASMNKYATDPKVVMASESGWSKLTESKDLIIELLVYTNLDRKTYSSVAKSSPLEDLDTLDVTSLRERLQMANLDCDGSREMLVKRMKVDSSREMLAKRLKEYIIANPSGCVWCAPPGVVNPSEQLQLRRCKTCIKARRHS